MQNWYPLSLFAFAFLSLNFKSSFYNENGMLCALCFGLWANYLVDLHITIIIIIINIMWLRLFLIYSFIQAENICTGKKSIWITIIIFLPLFIIATHNTQSTLHVSLLTPITWMVDWIGNNFHYPVLFFYPTKRFIEFEDKERGRKKEDEKLGNKMCMYTKCTNCTVYSICNFTFLFPSRLCLLCQQQN